jgi:hypothetical protein
MTILYTCNMTNTHVIYTGLYVNVLADISMYLILLVTRMSRYVLYLCVTYMHIHAHTCEYARIWQFIFA